MLGGQAVGCEALGLEAYFVECVNQVAFFPKDKEQSIDLWFVSSPNWMDL